jgi:hypothetical protein
MREQGHSARFRKLYIASVRRQILLDWHFVVSEVSATFRPANNSLLARLVATRANGM